MYESRQPHQAHAHTAHRHTQSSWGGGGVAMWWRGVVVAGIGGVACREMPVSAVKSIRTDDKRSVRAANEGVCHDVVQRLEFMEIAACLPETCLDASECASDSIGFSGRVWVR